MHVHSLVSGVARWGCHEWKGTRSRDNRARQLYDSLKKNCKAQTHGAQAHECCWPTAASFKIDHTLENLPFDVWLTAKAAYKIAK